jgi:tetratricopeptide (TPR) repeat protein
MLFHGLLLQEVGDLGNAEKAFREVVSGAPGPSQQRGSSLVLTARHNLALILRRQERMREAEAQWRSALADAADFWPAWLGLGELCVMEKRFAEAEGILQRLEGGRNGHAVIVGHGQGPDGQAVELPAALLRARLYLARRDFLAAKVHLQGLIGRRLEGERRKAEGGKK